MPNRNLPPTLTSGLMIETSQGSVTVVVIGRVHDEVDTVQLSAERKAPVLMLLERALAPIADEIRLAHAADPDGWSFGPLGLWQRSIKNYLRSNGYGDEYFGIPLDLIYPFLAEEALGLR